MPPRSRSWPRTDATKRVITNFIEPSADSLREIAEVNLKDGSWRRNPYAQRIAREGVTIVLPPKRKRRRG